MAAEHEADPGQPPFSQHQDALNYTFYEHRPQDYFSRRLALAQTMLNNGGELFHVVLNSVSSTQRDRQTTTQLYDEQRVLETRAYVAMDVEMLKFHTIETMLRYFIGHVTAPTRPWQKISGLEDRRELWRELRAVWDVDEADRLETIATVFFGAADDRHIDRDLASVLNERTKGIELFLSHFIDYYVDWGDDNERHRERERYNAAKHGMALVTVPTRAFSNDGDLDEIGLAHLDYEGDTGRKMWRLKIAWTDPEVVLLETFSAIMLLEQIWAVGRQQSGLFPDVGDVEGDIAWSAERFADLEDLLERRSGRIARDLSIDDTGP